MITLESLISRATELHAEALSFSERPEIDGLCDQCSQDVQNVVSDSAEIVTVLRQVKHCQHGKGTVSI